MFYHSGVIIAPSLKTGTFAGHLSDKKSSLDKFPSSASLRRSTARLRKVRWTIYKKIGSNERDVRRSLGYYKSLVLRFLKRFSVKLKSRETIIWKEKLDKTSKDVENFLNKKPKFNSTHQVNSLVHAKSESRLKVGGVFDASGKLRKKKENAKKVNDEKLNTTKTCDKCEACTTSTNYTMLVIIFAIQKLLLVESFCTKMYKAEENPEVPIREHDFSDDPIAEQSFDNENDAIEEEDKTSENKDVAKSTATPFSQKLSGDVQKMSGEEHTEYRKNLRFLKKWCPGYFQCLLKKKFFYQKRWMKVSEDPEVRFSEPFKMMSLINEVRANSLSKAEKGTKRCRPEYGWKSYRQEDFSVKTESESN